MKQSTSSVAAARKGTAVSSIATLLAPFIVALDAISFGFHDPTWATLATVAVEIIAITYGYAIRPMGLLLSLFVVSTFTFLTGRMLVVGIFDYKSSGPGDWGMHLNDSRLITCAFVMQQVFVVSISLAVGYAQRRTGHRAKLTNLTPQPAALNAGTAGLLVGAAMYMQNRVSVVASVNQSSYFDYYTSQSSLVSTTGRIGEALMIVGYAFILAGIPRFQAFIASSAVILAAHGFDLLMGRRAPFVLTLLLVIFYGFLRASLEDSSGAAGRWPTTGRIAFGTILLAPVVELLNVINRTRAGGATASGSGGGSPLGEFLYSQGVSANLLVYSQTNQLDIPHDRFYTFGPLIEFIQTRLTPGFDASLYDGQTAERAIQGYNFADIVSYRIMPTIYVRGGGYGSSALAELFWDFGWMGLALGGFVLGLIVAQAGRVLQLSVPLAAVALVVSREMLYAPRAPYLDWLVGSLNVYNIAAFLALSALWAIISTSRGSTSRTMRTLTREPIGSGN